MDIVFFVSYEDEFDNMTVVLSEKKKVREMIIHVLKQLGKETIGTEKYCFMYGQKLISSPKYLDKTLKEIGLQSNRKLKIMNAANLKPA